MDVEALSNPVTIQNAGRSNGRRRYKLAMFDFDGTLADTFPFFTSVFNQLADTHGFRKFDAADVPALRHMEAREIMKLAGLPAWKMPRVARGFIRMMNASAGDIRLFSGVHEMLAQLADENVTIGIVSSNSRTNVHRILGAENTSRIQHFECGMSMFGKSSRLRKVVARAGVLPAEAIYIGDQISDLLAARRESIAFGAVSWGYALPEALRAHGPDEEFTEVGRIASTLSGWRVRE